MPTYHTKFYRSLPALPGDMQQYVFDLEALHSTTDQFLRKRKTIRDLRQAMRQAEESGKAAKRLQTSQRSRQQPKSRQPGQNLQPPRECEYCGAPNAERIVWIHDKKRWTNYLCADCDMREITELNT